MKQLKKFRKIASVGCLMAVALVGCGESGPKVVPVDGVLSLDGKPLPFKSITFVPAEGTAGKGAAGYSNTQGNYVLKAFISGATVDFDGCPPGKYKVLVGEPMIPISEKDFDEDGAVKALAEESEVAIFPGMRPPKSEIPAAYKVEFSTPLIVEVPAEGGTINLELLSSAK